MVSRRWRRRAVALAASVLLASPAVLGASSAMAASAPAAARRAGSIPAASVAATVRDGQPHQRRQLPAAGFDGILVAAIGTGLTGAGWLLMLTGSRRLRRRSPGATASRPAARPDSLGR